jgi:hypothetical protein
MRKDEVIEEVRKVREHNAAKINFDLKAMFADACKRQKDSGHPVVSFATSKKKGWKDKGGYFPSAGYIPTNPWGHRTHEGEISHREGQ